MRVLVDACVLYPTVLREIVMGVAKTGAFTPLWSARILEEWARAAARLGPEGEVVARGEIALLRARWPTSEIAPDPGLERSLSLPDPDDAHVLAAAIAGNAAALLTLNVRDFPLRALSEHGILRRHPDEFLLEAWHADPAAVDAVVGQVHKTAEQLSGETLDLRALLKRARVPRFAKALANR